MPCFPLFLGGGKSILIIYKETDDDSLRICIINCIFMLRVHGGRAADSRGRRDIVSVDNTANQRNTGVAVNKDGVVFIAFENTGATREWDLKAVISPDWENWIEVVISSRDPQERDPKVAADPVTGNFGVTWYDRDGADGDDFGEWFRIFQPDGTPVTDPISVSDDYSPSGAGGQGWGSCAFNPVTGNIYVLNEDWGGGAAGPSPDGDGDSQILRAFDGSTGAKVAGPIHVNTSWAGDQDDGFLAFAEDGSFVAVWRDLNEDIIWFQRFAPHIEGDFEMVGEEVDTSADSDIFFIQNPDIGSSADGHFVIIYEETRDATDGDGRGMYFSLFDPDSNRILQDVLVNENTTGNQRDGEVAMDKTGRFVIVWEDESGIDGDGTAVMCRAFNPDGSPIGPEMIVNTITTGAQTNASVDILSPESAAAAGFDFVVSYCDESGNDGDGQGVFARRFLFEEIVPVNAWMLF